MGVTQGPLADIARISRIHLSRLLNGRQELTDQHKAMLDAALNKFLPDALTAKIDYIRIRFPTQDVRYVIEDVLWLRMRHIEQKPCSFYGYTSMFYHGDIAVLLSPYEERGILLELKGKGCTQFGNLLNGQGHSWGVFFQHCLNAKGVFKRLDIAIDDRAGFLNIPKLIEKCGRGECVTRFHRYEIHESSENTYLEEQHLERERWEKDFALMRDADIWDDPSLLEWVGTPLQEEIELAERKGRSGKIDCLVSNGRLTTPYTTFHGEVMKNRAKKCEVSSGKSSGNPSKMMLFKHLTVCEGMPEKRKVFV